MTPNAIKGSEFVVQHPFNNTSLGADLVLRSSDFVDFYASKATLASASPVFHDMMIVGDSEDFAPDQFQSSSEETKSGLPVVVMYDCPAPCLNALLQIIYSLPPAPTLDALGLGTTLCIAENAHKYDMSEVLDFINNALSIVTFDKADQGPQAMQAYLSVSQARGLQNIVVLHFAQETLRFSVQETYTPDLQDHRTSAADVWRLFAYRKRVEDKLAANAADVDRMLTDKTLEDIQDADESEEEAESIFEQHRKERLWFLSYIREAIARPLSGFQYVEPYRKLSREGAALRKRLLTWSTTERRRRSNKTFADVMQQIVSKVELD